MSCRGFLTRSSSLKRVNSDLENKSTYAEDDAQSYLISGNLNQVPEELFDSEEEEECEDEFEDCMEEVCDEEAVVLRDVEKAEEVLLKAFGVNCCVKKFVKLLLTDKLSSTDLVVQSLVYKIQTLTNGPKSVRYLPSWGMFWAGIRNLIKARGVVGFTEHFSIPSRMSKFKDKIIEVCGLQKSMLGKSGLQKENINLFVKGKQREIEGKTLCVSLSLDGKKIAVTQGHSGREDMGGLANIETPDEIEKKQAGEKVKILSLLDQAERQNLFSVYDAMSNIGQGIVKNLVAIQHLIESNSKRLEKNPRLSKYLFVLNQKLLAGMSLMRTLESIQVRLIRSVSVKRNCLNLTPGDGADQVSFLTQANFFQLSVMDHKEEEGNMQAIEFLKKKAKARVEVSCFELEDKLSRPLFQIPRGSRTFDAVLDFSFLKSDQVYQASGLSKVRPLQDMKSFYKYLNDINPSPGRELTKVSNPLVVATFCSHFAPITFGANMFVKEVGIFVANKLVSTPDLIVVNKENEIMYTVIFNEVLIDTFENSEEIISTAHLTSFCCNAVKGSLIVNFSDVSFVVSSVPNNPKLSEDFISHVLSYTSAPKCLMKRSKEISMKIDQLRAELTSSKANVTVLGCYPLVKVEVSTGQLRAKGFFLQPSVRHLEGSKTVEVDLLKEDVCKLLDEHYNFESKSARELIAVNISDLSGCVSKFPHTILAGAFLSSSSLKVVAKEVLKETTDMLTGMGVCVLNYGVDGESLSLAASLPNGAPGTHLALAKYLLKKLQLFSKSELIRLCAENRKITISEDDEIFDDMEEEFENLEDLDFHLSNSLPEINESENGFDLFSLEDLEMWLSSDDGYCEERENACKKLKKEELKFACLKYLFQIAKRAWLRQLMGREGFKIILRSKQILYTPNTVFHQLESGLYQTVTFDTAHLSNLLRESASKNRLSSLGLSKQSLEKLSSQNGFEYLKKILKLKNQQCLEFDPMNQKCSELLFSARTEEGLRNLKDYEGAECCKLLRNGIIEGLDTSGISAEERICHISALKLFLDEKIDIVEKMKKSNKESNTITNELLQMINCSLDSHIATCANLEFFNPRRKSTGSVEQFFSQVTLMCQGGSKLNCREISDILSRVMLTNALRLAPFSVKGFSFLQNLGMHMTSYKSDKDGQEDSVNDKYPRLKKEITCDIEPRDSNFDKGHKKPKRKLVIKDRDKRHEAFPSTNEFDGNVRKFHKKF